MSYHLSDQPRTFSSLRPLADLLLLFAVLFSPWYIVAMLACGGFILFEDYLEGFFAGLLMDALYGTRAIHFYGFSLFFTAGSILLYSLLSVLKKKMRFWNV